MSVAAFDQAVRLVAQQRASDACEVRVLDDCLWGGGRGLPRSLQHRRARGMGGSRDHELGQAPNALVVCGDGVRGCHGWIEDHPAKATEYGWRLGPGEDPRTTPVRLWDGREVYLGDGWWYE